MLRNRKSRIKENVKREEKVTANDEKQQADKPTEVPHSISENKKKEPNDKCLTFVVVFAAAVIAIALGLQVYVYSIIQENAKNAAVRQLGQHGLKLFKEYDINKDMQIDPKEFRQLYDFILSEDILKASHEVEEEITKEIFDPSTDEIVQLKADMIPLVLSSMSQTNKNPAFGTPLFHYSKDFSGLVAWKSVKTEQKDLYAKEFKAFLPNNSSQLVGEPYWLIQRPNNPEELTSNRYRYPIPKTKIEKLLHNLLVMFHPRPFVTMRFSPQGAAAVIRAQNQVYLEIVFRFHSEFQLNEPPYLPYWFTPAQFTGRLIIARDGTHVRGFQLYVPNNKKLNVDMEWETNDPNAPENNMEVDIGFLPLMTINQTQPSSPMILNNDDGTSIDRRELIKQGKDIVVEFDEIQWKDDAITTQYAHGQLEKLFFPFKKVDYLPFNEAFKRASVENKLIHQVVLWGALDDQSC
uniref:EF-hand domain-containing protein n=2 Tax=Ciona intestinalis TaxID=7719 RepID=F6PH23_CIOIN